MSMHDFAVSGWTVKNVDRLESGNRTFVRILVVSSPCHFSFRCLRLQNLRGKHVGFFLSSVHHTSSYGCSSERRMFILPFLLIKQSGDFAILTLLYEPGFSPSFFFFFFKCVCPTVGFLNLDSVDLWGWIVPG